MIGAKRITAPDGTVWRVGRRWLPDKPVLWRPRGRRGSDGAAGDLVPDVGIDSIDDAIAIVVAVLAIVVLFIVLTTVVFPIVVFGVELLLVAVLLIAGVAGRLLFRRPWTIRARADNGRELTWRAVGFRRSGRVRDDAAVALALGHNDIHPSEALR